MTREDAIAAILREADAAKALGVTGLYLFGSTARNAAHDGSDVDLFVDIDESRRFSLVDLVGVKLLLERRLGVPVDVMDPRQPRPAAPAAN